MHQVYLSLGSNIEPEVNLPKGIELLQVYGEIRKVSSAWESEAVGSDGPNFLNACVLLVTQTTATELKEKIIDPVESRLGRKRTADKNSPRTIDVDAVLFDNQLLNPKFWKQAFVVVPLAEIYPEYQNPTTRESTLETATRLRQSVWMETRQEVLAPFNGSNWRA